MHCVIWQQYWVSSVGLGGLNIYLFISDSPCGAITYIQQAPLKRTWYAYRISLANPQNSSLWMPLAGPFLNGWTTTKINLKLGRMNTPARLSQTSRRSIQSPMLLPIGTLPTRYHDGRQRTAQTLRARRRTIPGILSKEKHSVGGGPFKHSRTYTPLRREVRI